MSGSGVLAADIRDPSWWRSLVRRWAGGVHALGFFALGALMLTTEGPSAPIGDNPTILIAAAWFNLAAVVVFWAAQGALAAVWWRLSAIIRSAAGGHGPRPRLALTVCVALLLAAVWQAEAAFLLQALASVGAGGGPEPISGPAKTLLAAAALTGLGAPIAGGLCLLAAAAAHSRAWGGARGGAHSTQSGKPGQ